jgi:hypothetical protein
VAAHCNTSFEQKSPTWQVAKTYSRRETGSIARIPTPPRDNHEIHEIVQIGQSGLLANFGHHPKVNGTAPFVNQTLSFSLVRFVVRS